MLRKFLRAKIHQAVVTDRDPEYVGSATLDATLLRAAGLRPNEAVSVYDIDNGARFETYLIRGAPDSGTVGINGAAARLVNPGDRLIVACYGYLTEAELDDHEARVIVAGERNEIARELTYESVAEPAAPV